MAFALSGGKVPDAEPYKDEAGEANWHPAPGEPSMYGGARGKFLKHCWVALLRAAASSLKAVGGVGNVYEAAKDIGKTHTVSGTQEEADKCKEIVAHLERCHCISGSEQM